jgi:transposase
MVLRPWAITEGTVVYTDEYDIYSRLREWGYDHRTVCHAEGEYARGGFPK